MSRHRWQVLAPLGLLVLAGCITGQATQTTLQTDWTGHKADDFFLAYGPPQSQYALDNGNRLIHWSSGVQAVTIPGSSNSYGSVIGNTVSVTTYSSPASNIGLECALDLEVDKAGTIRALRIATDTIGLWRLDRCREYLKLKS